MYELKIKRQIVSEFATNCYLVERNKKCIIIDPGAAKSDIVRGIEELQAKPVAIFLTHGHYDHIGAVMDLKREYDIPVYAYEEEKDLLESSALNLSQMFGLPISLKADVWVKDNEVIRIEDFAFKVIHTPGHTQGSCCFYMEIEKVLFSGDTLFCCSRGRTDFPTGSESKLIRSIRDKLLVLPEDVKVFAGHNQETTIGDEKPYY